MGCGGDSSISGSSSSSRCGGGCVVVNAIVEVV